jgi:ubiquinone/menaquinone biosynthesis C-methylase UbiE
MKSLHSPYQNTASLYHSPANLIFYKKIAQQLATLSLHHIHIPLYKHACSFLEFGSGSGISSEVFLNHFPHASWIFLDSNKDMLLKAQTSITPTNNKISFLLQPAENTGLENNSVDATFSSLSYHWFEKDLFINELKRILKKNGLSFFAIPLTHPKSHATGNKLLRSQLKKNKTNLKSTRPLGLKKNKVLNEFKDFQILETNEFSFKEDFPSKEVLLDTLYSRGSLYLFMNEHSTLEDLKNSIIKEYTPVSLEWRILLLALKKTY